MITYNIAGTEVRDWQHAWRTCGDGWEAFDIWLAAKWDPLTPGDRLAFALSFGYPVHIDSPLPTDPFGDLEQDGLLSVWAYANDPDVPSHMIEPAWCGSWPRLESELPF